MHFVWNHKNKKSKVHICVPGDRAEWYKHEVPNPDFPGQIQHWTHALCKARVYTFTESPHTRKFSEDYTFSEEYPKGLELCGSCLEAHVAEELLRVRETARYRIEGG